MTDMIDSESKILKDFGNVAFSYINGNLTKDAYLRALARASNRLMLGWGYDALAAKEALERVHAARAAEARGVLPSIVKGDLC